MPVEIVVLTRDELANVVETVVERVLASYPKPAVWLTTEAAAELLGLHPKTTARLARTGEIPATRLGNAWRFRRDDVEAYLSPVT